MKQGQARAIAEQYALPETELSRQVMKSIFTGDDCPSSTPHSIRSCLDGLRADYFRMRDKLGAEVKPRYLPFYLLIQEKYPGFNWLESAGQLQIETYFRGFKPNLLSYLLEMIPPDEIATTAKISKQVEDGVPVWLTAACREVFEQQGVCSLTPQDWLRLQRWIQAGRRGETLSLVSPVCPDYSAEQGESRAYRFTFSSVGTGVGLACMRLFESLAVLAKLFTRLGRSPNIKVFVLLGDFEAFSATNCQRMGLSMEAFLARLRQSCASILAAAPLPLEVQLFTDCCGGMEGWQLGYGQMKARMTEAGLQAGTGHPLVGAIAEARKPLYRRWFGDAQDDPHFFEKLVIDQGIEYALMGDVIERGFKNPLVIGADHHKMAPFYNFAADMPVMYLDRNYE
jgi:hypothetical protein